MAGGLDQRRRLTELWREREGLAPTSRPDASNYANAALTQWSCSDQTERRFGRAMIIGAPKANNPWYGPWYEYNLEESGSVKMPILLRGFYR
jgi:hypothetical protein